MIYFWDVNFRFVSITFRATGCYLKHGQAPIVNMVTNIYRQKWSRDIKSVHKSHISKKT